MTVSLCINYHSEGLLALKSAISANLVADYAKQRGLEVEIVAVLDKADKQTQQIVEDVPFKWDKIIITDEGDLGAARNYAAKSLTSDFIGFLDGDDLCGKTWIFEAWSFWKNNKIIDSVLHPEFIYYFDERDFFDDGNLTDWRRSFWFRQIGSDSNEFQVDSLKWNNTFTSNFFTSRVFLEKYPIPSKCIEHGMGVEDWTWNYLTTVNGIQHLVVPSTLHLVRITGQDSLSTSNNKIGLLPDLTNHCTYLH